MKVVENENWKIRYGIWEGDKHLAIYNLQGNKPVCLTFMLSGDIDMSYFSMEEDPRAFKEQKRFTIDESCPILPALLILTEEKTYDFLTDKELSHIESPLIKDDSSRNTMQASKTCEGMAIDFVFSDYCEQGINIKNIVYDGRSDIDRRHSDYKGRLIDAVNESFNILNNLNPIEEKPLDY